jgi:hypothetical protein
MFSMPASVLLAAAFALVVASAHPAGAQLPAAQVQGVTKCQQTIAKESRALAKKEQEAMDACGSAKLTAVVRHENGVTTPAKFDTENAKATTKCEGLFAGVAAATTKFVDKVLAACNPVAAAILDPDPAPDGDPLGLVELWGATTIEELAGALCIDALTGADFLAEGRAPRAFTLVLDDPDIAFPDIDIRCDCPC